MNFVLSDNVRILCLSCHAIKPKSTAKWSTKSRNKRPAHPFFLTVSMLILFPFFTIAQHESGIINTPILYLSCNKICTQKKLSNLEIKKKITETPMIPQILVPVRGVA